MYQSPITKQNFQQAWDYGCRKNRQVRRRHLVRKLVIPVSQILFFLCFLIITYGVAYDGFPNLVRSFLTKIPYTAAFWQQFSSLLLDSAGSQTEQLVRLILFVYGVPLAGALIFYLPVMLFYHPRKPVLSSDPSLHSRDLYVLSQDTFEYRTPRYISSLPFFSLLFAMILIGGCVAFLLYYKHNPTVFSWLQAGMAQASLYFVLGCFIVFLLYLVLNLPLRMVVSLLYTCRVPKSFPEDAEKYRWAETRKENQQMEQNLKEKEPLPLQPENSSEDPGKNQAQD